MKLPVQTILRLIYFFALNFKICDAIVHCDLSSRTASIYIKIFRRVCYSYQLSQSGFKICGDVFNVEIEKTYVCKQNKMLGNFVLTGGLAGGWNMPRNELNDS